MDSDTPASSVLPRCPQNTVLTKLIMKVMVWEITWRRTRGGFTFTHPSNHPPAAGKHQITTINPPGPERVHILLFYHFITAHHRPGQFEEVSELVAVLQGDHPAPGPAGAAASRGLLPAGGLGRPVLLRPLRELLPGRVHDAAAAFSPDSSGKLLASGL